MPIRVDPCPSVSLLAVCTTFGAQLVQGADVSYDAFIEAFFFQEIGGTFFAAGLDGFHEFFGMEGCSTRIALDRIESGVMEMFQNNL